MKIKHILFLLVLIPTAAQPANRSSDIAQAIAQRFYSQLRPDARRSASALKQTFPKLITRTNDTIDAVEVCYAYNFGDSDGFVLVRSDDALPEILGYSTNGRIPEEALPENLSHWLLGYRAGDHASEVLTWNASDSILPVMEDIQWNQLAPYNNDCPISSTYQERCATDCVATAMAQIMKYYEWPPEGVGQKSYSLIITETDTTISEIFDGTLYDWANMQNHYNGTQTAIQQAAVAKLMYHCGVAAEMSNGIASQGGSGASVRNAGLGLFKDDLLVTSLFAQSEGILLPGYGYQRYSKTISLNKGLADGSYEMRLYFEDNGIKTPFYTRDSLNNHLMVTFLGNTATIETPTSSNDSLTQLTTITQNTSPTQAEVYDLTGKRLLQASDPEHLRIDRLPTGFYLLRTRTIKGEQTSKFYKP